MQFVICFTLDAKYWMLDANIFYCERQILTFGIYIFIFAELELQKSKIDAERQVFDMECEMFDLQRQILTI